MPLAADVRDVWPLLREPLRNQTFAEIKEIAAAATLATDRLSHLRQTSGGSTSKSTLVDAIDGLFNELADADKDRVTVYVVNELATRCGATTRERLEMLLERVGWQLVGDEPLPLELRIDVHPGSLPPPVGDALRKAVRRYRDGDLDGAMTSIVGVVDMVTEAIYTAEGLPGHHSANYQQRAVTAHKTREPTFRATVGAMAADEADRTWEGQKRAVNGAADVLGAFRRNFSDAHGSNDATATLLQAAIHAALLVVYSLLD